MPRVTPLAVLVPDAPLLVPGVSGRADVLADVRSAAADVVADLVAPGPRRVVVAAVDAPGPADGIAPDLTPTGVPWPTAARPVAGAPAAVGAAVAGHLLERAGWSGPTTTLRADGDAGVLAALGRELAAADGTVLLAAGSLSARHGTDAPLAHDPRAADLDEAVLADLARADDDALVRLAAVDRELAAELAVTAWGPVQVLVGALGTWARAGGVVGHLRATAAPFGVPYVVASWGRA